MKKMEFSVRQVRECLLRHGHVYTVRAYDMWNEYVWVDGVGRCFRQQFGEVTGKADLERFLRFSGFATVDEWWQVIEMFCKGRKKWVYFVFLRNPAGG